jgi:ribosomal-protein-alanine N-acetyltransferase
MTRRRFATFPVLKTERLALRQLRSSDAKEIFALRSNSKVNTYLDRKPSKSIDDAENFIQAINESIQQDDSIYWVIALHSDDKLIGTICLFNLSEDYSKAEIGYELLPEFQGREIMQEVLLEVIRFGFQQVGLNSIEACSHSKNQSSIRLLEKLNFKKTKFADENLIVFELASAR